MKKRIKMFTVLLLITILCFMLCGCKAEIDKMREMHGVFTQDDSIMLNGVEYKPLPFSENLMYLNDEGCDYIYVTDADVPLLLSQNVGNTYYLSYNEIFLTSGIIEQYEKYPIYDNSSSFDGDYYCRADKYDDVVKSLNEGFKPDCYTYRYIDYIKDIDGGQTSEYVLNDAQVKALEYVVSNVANVAGDDIYFESHLPFEVYVNRTTSDGFMSEYVYNVYILNDTYYIYMNNDSQTIIVPDEYNSIFEEMLRPVVESETAYNNFYLDRDYEGYYIIEKNYMV